MKGGGRGNSSGMGAVRGAEARAVQGAAALVGTHSKGVELGARAERAQGTALGPGRWEGSVKSWGCASHMAWPADRQSFWTPSCSPQASCETKDRHGDWEPQQQSRVNPDGAFHHLTATFSANGCFLGGGGGGRSTPLLSYRRDHWHHT